MPSIIYIHPDGRGETVEADSGASAMITALTHGVEGIVGECGGNAMCATCHVYVDEGWFDRLPPRSDDEDALRHRCRALAEQPPLLPDQDHTRTRRPRAAPA